MLHNLHQNLPNGVIISSYDSASCGCGGAVKHAVWVYVTCLACLLGQEQWWLVCTECSSVFVVMAPALGVVGYSLATVVDMACDITLPAALCWMRFLPTSPESSVTSQSPVEQARFLPTSPASSTTSQSPVEQGSCGPDLRATLLASRCWARFLWTWLVSYATSISLLNEFLVDLTCKLQTTSHSVVLAALLLETEWIRLGWDLEELPSFVKLVSLINEHFWFVVSLILYFLIGCCRNVNAVK